MNIKQIAMSAVPIVTLGAVALAAAAPVTRAGGHADALHRDGVKSKQTTTELFGGGATLPALAYVGKITTNPQVTDAVGSAFYYYGHSIVSGETVSYCQTGSGFGKKVLDGVDASGTSDANLTCPALGAAPVTGTNGFSSTNQNVADFVGSDAPLASTEYSSFVTNGATTSTNPIAGRIEPVQLPVLAGAVAVYYNNSDPAVEAFTSGIPMTDEALCKVASGSIGNWNALYTELKAEGQPVGTTAWQSTSLYFVSRYDGSGTSFSFTNHLSAVCSKYGITTFGANQTYSAIITANPSGANFVAASGNSAVASCIKSSTNCLTYASASPGTSTTIPSSGNGAIGYVEAANVGSAITKPDGYATINGKNPFKDLPAAAALITGSSLVTDETVNQTTAGGGQPTLSALTPPDKKGCVVVATPASYAAPTSGYPIVAVTNLDFSEKLNNGKSTQEQSLASMFYNAANFSSAKISSVDVEGTTVGKTGYSTLNIPSTNTTITGAVSCIESP